MATTIIDTLITKVKFDSDTAGLKSATKSIGSFKTNIIGILGPVVALFSGGLFINKIADTADKMIKFADATGVAVEELQDLEFAIQRQGGSISGLRSSLTNLAKNLGELSLGKGRAKDIFEALGLSAFDADGKVKSATDALFELNIEFQNLSKSEAVGFGTKLGLDIGTIQLLQTAPKELQALIARSKEFGRISEEDARLAAKFNDSLTNLNTSISRIAQSIGISMLPVLTEFISDLVDVVAVVRENSEFFILLAKTLGILVAGLIAGAVAMRALTAASVLAAVIASPFILLPAAILGVGVALTLLIDDFIAWRAGADSALGGVFEDFFRGAAKVREVVLALFAPLKTLFNLIGSIGEGTAPEISSFDELFERGGLSRTLNLNASRAGGQPVSNRSTTINGVNVTINAPGADAKEISAAIGSELTEQLRAAAQDNDSSIAR